jgi:hypothetical protein
MPEIEDQHKRIAQVSCRRCAAHGDMAKPAFRIDHALFFTIERIDLTAFINPVV